MSYEKVELRLAPNFIQPDTIKNLTEEEQRSLLEQIREKRLVVVTLNLGIQAAKKQAKGEKLKGKLEKVSSKILKQVAKIDGALEELELLFNESRQLRLEAEFDT